MPAAPLPDPQLRIFDATMRAMLGPADLFTPHSSPDEVDIPLQQPASDGLTPPRPHEEIEEITVELPRIDDSQPTTAQATEPALFLLSRGRHRMW